MAKLNLEQKIILRKLNDHNVAKLEICYSGGGDDGCIDDYHFYDIDDNNLNLNIEIDLDDYVYELLSDNIEWDWVNNEGGWGVLNVNIVNGEVSIDHTQRHTEDYSYIPTESKEMLKAIDGTS